MLARSKMSREGAKALGIHKSLPDHTPKKPGLLKRGAELVNTFRSKVKKWGDEGLAKHKEKQQDRLQTAKTKAMGREGKREPGMFSKLAGAAKRVIGRVGDHVAASARARAPRLTHMAIGKEKIRRGRGQESSPECLSQEGAWRGLIAKDFWQGWKQRKKQSAETKDHNAGAACTVKGGWRRR